MVLISYITNDDKRFKNIQYEKNHSVHYGCATIYANSICPVNQQNSESFEQRATKGTEERVQTEDERLQKRRMASIREYKFTSGSTSQALQQT